MATAVRRAYMVLLFQRIMANDGCQTPSWTGQAFAYLPHHPREAALASQSYAQQRPQGDRAFTVQPSQAVTVVSSHCVQ